MSASLSLMGLPITDFEVPELAPYLCGNENRLARWYEPQPGLFIAESLNVITRALDAGYEPCSFLIEESLRGSALDGLLARCPEIPVFTGPQALLDRLNGFHLTGGILCAMKRRPPAAPQALFAKKRLAVLEGITNPTNVGAIFRSAAALGMDGVLLCHGCADPLYRRCIRVSMGTVFGLPWAWLPGKSTRTDVAYLKEQGFRTSAMALEKHAIPLDALRYEADEKAAILLGSEGYGLSPETIRDCDDVVLIPMAAGVDSLNVAAASAVVFWHLRGR